MWATSLAVLFPLDFVKVKVEAIPLEAWTDPRCSKKLRLPDFKTIGT
jgi:hypothetical protein